MRPLYSTILICLLFIILSPTETFSRITGTEEKSTKKLDPVVVTSTSIPVELSSTVSSVTVLDKEYIDSQHTDNLVDILQQVPGLYVDQSSGMAGTSSVYLRGGDPNFTLVLIDGIRVNNPANSRGGSFDLTTLSVTNIERIEIIRSPLSALYGSDAISGVINIITKNGEYEFSNIIDSSASSEGGYSMFAELGDSVKRLNYSFSSSYHDDGEPVEESSFSNFTISSNIGYSITDNADLSIVSRLSATDKERFPDDSGGPEFAVIREREISETDQFLTGIDLNLDHSSRFSQRFNVDLFYTTEELSSPGVAPGIRDSRGVPARMEKSGFFRNEFSFINSYSPFEKATFSFGLDTVYEEGTSDSTLFLENELSSKFKLDRFYYAVFGELIYSPFRGLELVAGVRFDILDDFENELSPRLGLSYFFPGTSTQIRISYAEGFKLPSFFALGNPIVGNRELDSESSRSLELGFVQYLFHNQLKTSLTLFYNDFENLVDLQEEPQLRLVNRSNVTSTGLEFEMLLTLSNDINISGNLSYIETDIKDSEEELRNRPEWLANLVFNWRAKEYLNIFVNANYAGDTLDSSIPTGDLTLDGYLRVDTAVSLGVGERVDVYLRIENLFDEEYQQFVGFDAPGIRPIVGVRGRL